MWRKIHSNRDPKDTLYSEVRREFGGYFSDAGDSIRRALQSYPKVIYVLMIIFMIISIALSFTVFRHHGREPAPQAKNINPVSDGFSKIMETASKIKQGLHLKKVVDSLSRKSELTSADSTALENALDTLQKIQH